MNDQFVALLTARLEDLVKELRYTYKPDGSEKAPQIVDPMLPGKDRSHQEGEEFPLVRWAIFNGEFARMSPAPFSVRVDAGIYTGGSIIDGDRDIRELLMALGKIVETPWYKPYKLRDPVKFDLGSPDLHAQGIQPHPYYWATLYLSFIVATGHGG